METSPLYASGLSRDSLLFPGPWSVVKEETAQLLHLQHGTGSNLMEH